MYQQIKSYLSKDIYPFHMPGHKRNTRFFPPNLQPLDLTEIPGMDNLAAPTGIIETLQQDMAAFYGADHSFLLVNGSSAGIIAAVCATCTDGSPLAAPRNAHTSVYNAMVMSGAVPHYIMPCLTPDGLTGGLSPAALDNIPQGAAVLVVSPTYEGFVSDIAAIAACVHDKGGVLIVDEAHGAHFPFSPAFPASALSQGADVVVQSLHKTLPAPSQCAVLHVKGHRVDVKKLKFFINTVQTSSPSYILMSVCDYMLRMLWREPAHFETYLQKLENLRGSLPGERSGAALRLSGFERVGAHGIYDIDPGKLLFTAHSNIDAETIANIMAADHKVQMEMAAGRHILAMTGVADTNEGFERLAAAIDALNGALSSLQGGAEAIQGLKKPAPPFFLPEMVIPPRQAVNLPSKTIPWEAAAGQVSAQLIAQYPPGIALVAPGERIPPGLPQMATHVCVLK